MKRCLPPRVCPRGGGGAPKGNGPESYSDYVPPRDVTGEVFGLSDAVVLTPAVAGASDPAVFAGEVALADLVGMDVPAVARMEFPAVAEDLSFADYAGDLPQSSVLVNHCGLVSGRYP